MEFLVLFNIDNNIYNMCTYRNFYFFFSSNLFSIYTFYLSKLILLLIGVRVKVHGNFPISHKNPFIYIANHSSYLDPVLNCYLINKKYKYLAKSEVLDWPFFGPVVKKHLIAVKREKRSLELTLCHP